jgi:hypothetical protein
MLNPYREVTFITNGTPENSELESEVDMFVVARSYNAVQVCALASLIKYGSASKREAYKRAS